MARTVKSGPIASKTKETDGFIWLPGIEFFAITGGGTFTITRVAIGDYVFRHTAAANTTQLVINLTSYVGLTKIGGDPNVSVYTVGGPSTADTGITTGAGVPTSGGVAHDIRGVLLNSIDIAYANTTADLVAFSASLRRTTYANGSANAVSTPSTTTGTLTLTASANPRLINLTCDTPFTMGGNTVDVTDWLELSVQTAATSAFDLYGVGLNCHYNLL